MIDLKKLNSAVDAVRVAIGMPDDLPLENCKEPEYAGGRAAIVRALLSADLISKNDAEIWFHTYFG